MVGGESVRLGTGIGGTEAAERETELDLLVECGDGEDTFASVLETDSLRELVSRG